MFDKHFQRCKVYFVNSKNESGTTNSFVYSLLALSKSPIIICQKSISDSSMLHFVYNTMPVAIHEYSLFNVKCITNFSWAP